MSKKVVFINGRIEVDSVGSKEDAIQGAFDGLRRDLPRKFREGGYSFSYYVEENDQDAGRGAYVGTMLENGHMINGRLTYIKGLTSESTGGGCMVDIITLYDGTLLTLTDDIVVHHKDLDHFYGMDEDGEVIDNSNAPFIVLGDDSTDNEFSSPSIPDSHDLPAGQVMTMTRFVDIREALDFSVHNSMTARQAIIEHAALATMPQLVRKLDYRKAAAVEIETVGVQFRVVFTWKTDSEFIKELVS